MRKLFLLAVVLAALVLACENKSPTGPAGVGPGGVTVTQTTSSTTTTTSIPSTTSTTTTTTTVVGSLSRHYVAFTPPPNVPADMTLFFELISQGLLSKLASRLPMLGLGPSAAETVYKVTGVYTMLNGTTGSVLGDLSKTLNPIETGGTFEGDLTARVGSCTATRYFAGPLGPQTLTWTGGGASSPDCPGSPLNAFNSFTLLRSDSTPLPTTTTVPTTTTSAVTCSYSLSATSAQLPAAGGTFDVVIATLSPCAWTAQSFASWATVTPASGTGAASVHVTVAANTGTTRTGTLVIAGITFTVTQVATVGAAGYSPS